MEEDELTSEFQEIIIPELPHLNRNLISDRNPYGSYYVEWLSFVVDHHLEAFCSRNNIDHESCTAGQLLCKKLGISRFRNNGSRYKNPQCCGDRDNN